jgi:Flp pilus assembly protein TadD
MSLLLEALKKAELAKQLAKAESSSPGPSSPAPAKPLMTREKLPDISQPLEILSDDLPSAVQKTPPPKASRSDLSLEPPSPPALSGPQIVSPPGQAISADNRAQAQQLFQVKEMDYNPRRPFYLTLATLALVGVGYGGYLWWQLRPKSTLGERPPAEISPLPVSKSAPVAPSSLSSPESVTTTSVRGPQTTGVAGAGAATAAVETVPPIRPVQPVPRATRKATGPGDAATGQAFSRRGPVARTDLSDASTAALAPISINPSKLVVDPLLEQAYEAFQRNDLAAARESYQRVLVREPNNRDALLGLAAIDLRLLELDPRDPYAVAGLTALRGQLDPVRSESRLKMLIASEPEATQLYFALGNGYAQQARWSDAQAAYFKAYSADPENADYAFNLAVSLDQLNQRKPALEYYQRALTLAKARPVSFNRDQAQTRVQELGRQTGK